MHRSIIGFHQDLEQHWVAELDCGHCQHTRHEPPFFPRPWVITEELRSVRPTTDAGWLCSLSTHARIYQ
jgi:Protein of unknown function (DUF3565)